MTLEENHAVAFWGNNRCAAKDDEMSELLHIMKCSLPEIAIQRTRQGFLGKKSGLLNKEELKQQ